MNRVILAAILLFFNLSLFAGEANLYDMVLVKTFKSGSGQGQLGSMGEEANPPAGWGYGPSAMVFNRDGRLIIADTYNERLVILDSSFSVEREVKLKNRFNITNAHDFVIEDNSLIAFDYSEYSFTKISLDGNLIYTISFFNNKYALDLDIGNYFDINGDFYHYLTDGRVVMIKSPGINNGENIKKLKILNKIVTKKVTDDTSSRGEKKEVLVNNNFKAFLEYHSGNKSSKVSSSRGSPRKTSVNLTVKSAPFMRYRDRDRDSNTYWDLGRENIAVYNSNGGLIDYFRYSKSRSKTLPAIHPNGDVYFMSYDAKGVYLYRINRVW